MNITRTFLTSLALAAFAASPLTFAAEGEWRGEAKDAWIDGKLEGSYLLNTELNNFRIDTQVKDGEVTLTGVVKSESHKQLAEQIASNLKDVTQVNNQLTVGETDYDMDETSRNFVTGFHDLTTTAGLKSEFALHSDVDGLDISVSTQEGVVTLEGEVTSEAEKQLAEQIAHGYEHVREVRNNLQVVGEGALSQQ